MAVRANWHLDVLPPPAQEELRVEDVGVPIDLRDPPELNRRLTELLGREAELYNAGVACPIKDASETTCLACPLRGRSERIAPLCEVGCEQDRVLTELAVSKVDCVRSTS